MTVAVRYKSRGGNTQAVAEVLADALGVTADSIDVPLTEAVDTLFLGGGTYWFQADKELQNYVKNLDSSEVKQIVTFSTSGGGEPFINMKLQSLAKQKGIAINEKSLRVQFLAKGLSLFGRKGGQLTDKQKEQVRTFAKQFTETVGK